MKPADGYNYQPVMIITLLQNNGKATREKIEEELMKNDSRYVRGNNLPFDVLIKNKVCGYNKSDKTYELLDFETFPDDNSQWQSVLVTKCKERMGEAKRFSKIESKSYMLLMHKNTKKNKWRDELGKRYHYNIKTVHYSKDIKPGTKTIWFYRKAKKYHFW